jgi:hypothetical protein
MKDVPVIRVYKLALPWLADEHTGRQPSIQESGRASDCPGLGRVRVHDVGSFTQEKAIQFPDSDGVVQRNFAAHLGEVARYDTHLSRKIAHVFFAFRNLAGDEQRVEARILQSRGQPDNMLCRSTHVQASNNANYFGVLLVRHV